MEKNKLLLEDVPEQLDSNDINRPKWSGYFKVVQPLTQTQLQTDSQSIDGSSLYSNSSWYQFVTYGSAARLNRYKEYDLMDGDCDITRALDIIAEEMCGNIGKNELPFVLDMSNDSQMPKNSHYVVALTAALKRWCEIQSFSTRIFPTNRKTIKYGDTFYKKKNNVEKWIPLSPKQIIGAVVNKDDVTDILGWQIHKNLLQAHGSETIGNYQIVGTEQNDADYELVNADEIVRFSINTELADTAPFGESVLQSVYRTFRQKQLLEDAILIYRLARAPERMLFKIDTRGIQPHNVHRFLDKVKNDMNQKMIPSPNASGGIESTYNPACLVLDTKIPLLDGRTLSLEELITEYNQGKQNWTYSVNPVTGELAPGKITWAGETRKNAQTVTLIFDNGKTLTCTLDHKIPTQNRGFVEAQYLTVNDSLFPFYTQERNIRKKSKTKYQQVFDISKKEFVYTHRMVAKCCINTPYYSETLFKHEGPKDTIHHVDFNALNNNPSNLTFMNNKDHVLYHSSLYERNKTVLLTNGKEYRDFINSNPMLKQKVTEQKSLNRKVWLSKDDNLKQIVSYVKKAYEQKSMKYDITHQNNCLKFSSNMFDILIKHIQNDINVAKKELLSILNNDNAFMGYYVDCNNVTSTNSYINHVNLTYFSETGLKNMLKMFGFKNLKHLKYHLLLEKLNSFTSTCPTESYLIDLVVKYGCSASAVIDGCKGTSEYDVLLDIINSKLQTNKKHIMKDNLTLLVQSMGYGNFIDFIKCCYYKNHKLTSIIFNDRLSDTGTLTIDGQHEIHDYHTFAIDAGIFVKNSMMENFYFPIGEDGKGSSVEILQGGMNLGELQDLEYFEDKVFRGMRVPLSYIKTKAENPAIFNDGKIGLAYIEEMRFSQYIERLQADQEKVYDTEFKKFVAEIGLNIDPSYFSIKLPSPTNFATYRELELNVELLNAISTADGIRSISKRYAMKKYLNWNEAEIAMNEQWKRQELGLKSNDPTAFRKIYDDTAQEDGDIGGGSFRDLDSSFGGNELDMGDTAEQDNVLNSNDKGTLNAGSGDQLGSSGAEK